jgi:membrane protease YdiL (CAAX protease family)
MNTRASIPNSQNFFNRIPVAIRAVVIGLTVFLVGITLWNIDFTFIPAPWSLLIMILILWGYVKYFSGNWLRNNNTAFRRTNFRKTKLSTTEWKLGLIGAILFVVVFQSSFVVTFRLTQFPEQVFKSQYKILDNFPTWLAWLTIIVSSLVAGICEETGFRGYMQVPFETRYGAFWGIIITSVFFFLLHLGKSWAPLIIAHIFFASVLLGLLAYNSGSLLPGIIGHTVMDIFNFSYWWSNVAGNFEKKTIFVTGVDIHFTVWCLIFLTATILFFFTISKLKKTKTLLA